MLRTLWWSTGKAMCDAFRERLRRPAERARRPGRFEDLEPPRSLSHGGNAFGIMNAGIDAACRGVFGDRDQRASTQQIFEATSASSPSEPAFVVPNGNEAIRS